ncbi:MAG TPA: energy-coupling factor transporter ATPase [Candidatus Binataceae bacterium]|nr:energy-coupling factor transporter ATPase [Candidatus Binataceae bacterium]
MKDGNPAPGAAGAALDDGAAGAAHAVALEGVSFTYTDGERPALGRVSFKVAAGEMVGVMGASGAGKSTLAKCLNRIVPEFEGGAFAGVVRIGGRSLDGARVCEVAPRVGMVFQDFEAQLFSTNVAHEVAFAMEQVGMERGEMARRIRPALEAVGLGGFEHRDPTSLSGGEKQRLAIASVLALRPAVIVLDEPTTDLDPEGKAEVFALIRRLREQGLSLIVIEHEAEVLRGADRLVLLREGEIIAEGAPHDLMTRLELLEECGVHPPDLNRVLDRAGIAGHAASVDEAEALIRRALPRLGASSHPVGATPDASAHESAQNATQDAADADGAPPLVEVRALRFNYPDGPPVLDSIDLRIAPGEFVAIIGQNGSGKTTLAKHLVGLLRPTAGAVMLNGRDRATMRPAETAAEVGYVFQNPDHQIFAATVEDEVAFGPRNFNLAPDEIERRCDEVLRAVGLQDARALDPFLLSKGERQRLAVASVLALRPRLLILDEPTTGLDYREQRRMMALVSELNRDGIAIIMITHTPWLVPEYARRVVLIRRGRKLYDGGVREFFARDELLASSSFRAPEATELSRRFGTVALGPDELAAWLRARG